MHVLVYNSCVLHRNYNARDVPYKRLQVGGHMDTHWRSPMSAFTYDMMFEICVVFLEWQLHETCLYSLAWLDLLVCPVKWFVALLLSALLLVLPTYCGCVYACSCACACVCVIFSLFPFLLPNPKVKQQAVCVG